MLAFLQWIDFPLSVLICRVCKFVISWESVIDVDALPDEFSNPGVVLLHKADRTLGSRVLTSLLRGYS